MTITREAHYRASTNGNTIDLIISPHDAYTVTGAVVGCRASQEKKKQLPTISPKVETLAVTSAKYHV